MRKEIILILILLGIILLTFFWFYHEANAQTSPNYWLLKSGGWLQPISSSWNVSSSQARFTSSTIATLLDFNGNKYSTSTGGGATGVTTSTPIFENAVAFFTSSNASSVVTTLFGLTVNSSTGVFASGSSSLTSVSSTNITASGYVSAGTLLQGSTGVVLTTRTVNTTSPLGGGGALSGNLTLTCTTCLVTQSLPSSTSWVDSQFLFGQLAGTATTSVLFTISTSTGVLSGASTSWTNVSSTNITASGYIAVGSNLVVLANRNINTTSPITGGGSLAADRTIACATCLVVQSLPSSTSWADGQILFGVLGGQASSSALVTISTSSGLFSSSSSSLTNVSSTNISVSSNLQVGKVLVDFNGNKYSTSSGDTFLSAGVDGQLLFGKLGGGATSSVFLTLTTSTAVFAVSATTSITGVASTTANFTFGGANTQILNQLTFTNASATRLDLSGRLNLSYAPSSRCLRTDANLNVQGASGDCILVIPTPSSTAWVDGQGLFGQLGGTATSSALLTISTSTGVVTMPSSSIGTASGTNISVTGYGLFPTLNFTNASGSRIDLTSGFSVTYVSSTNHDVSGYLVATGRIAGANVSSTNGVSAATLQATTRSDLSTASTSNLTVVGTLQVTQSSLFQGVVSTTANVYLGGANNQVSSEFTFANSSGTTLDVLSGGRLGLLYGTGSRCLRLNANLNVVAATGDCASGGGGFTNGTDAQVLQGVLGGNGTSSLLIQMNGSSTLGFGGVAASSSVLVLIQGSGVGTTTLLIKGFVNQTANLIQVNSSTGRILWQIGSTGVVSSSEERVNSSTIQSLSDFNGNKYVTSTAAAAQSNLNNQIVYMLTPGNSALPDVGFAYPQRTVTSTETFISLNFPPATSSDAFWGPFFVPPSMAFNTTTLSILWTSTSTSVTSATLGIYWNENTTSSNLTFDTGTWYNFKNVSSSYSSSTQLVVMGETVTLSSSTFSGSNTTASTGTLPSYFNLRINRPSTDQMAVDLQFLSAILTFW